MAKKFLLFLLLSAFSCDNTPKAYPAQNEDSPNFAADPNKFNYFENHFDTLITFLSNSLTQKSVITNKQIKQCVKYVVRFDDIKNFYDIAITKACHKDVKNLIFILASYYGNFLDEEISKYKESHNGKCPMEELVNEVYKKNIEAITVFKSVGIFHHSIICDKMKKSLESMLETLMIKRADIAFLVSIAIFKDQKLSSFLDNTLCELLDDDSDDYVEVLKRIFLDELELNNIVYFSPDVCLNAKHSQRDLFYNYFENVFHRESPEISFENVIKPYLIANKEYVVENLKEGILDFFKTHYQKYPIRFSKFTLSLLTQYLQKVVAEEDKKNISELLVLYLLNFYSTEQHFKTYVFSDIGQKMLRYNSFKNEDVKQFNGDIDVICSFIKDNKSSLDKDLFKEVTGKNIENGEKKIVEELLEQLNKGKRI